jgi:hypothetical protein
VPEDVVLVAVAMGGESTHTKAAIKAKSPNSSEAQLEVQACRAFWMVSGRVCGGFTSFKRALVASFV